MSEITTKVTTIDGNHHCRLLKEGKVVSEMACKLKEDIGYCCRTMLRWYDKLGFPYSRMADMSRHRDKNIGPPKGKVWKIK